MITDDDVEIEIECLNEECPIEGNCSSIDPQTDAENERKVREDYESGNEWAWCCVKVTVTCKGLTASDTLGCCSYADIQEFRESDYYIDMVDACMVDLNRQLNELISVAAAKDAQKATRDAIARGVDMMLCDWLTFGPITKKSVAELCNWIRTANLDGLK